eukprot:TRINITY_DN1935_c0_g1_i2.p1 TRINITY_DN1935_c0_g1~~TRINITY_DN1935_c0_g1_i2.p1  ORF type:complete len:277 (+),score=42.12 TRINITY_DN1935_c0_g1_i2:79-831(+)
MASSQNLSGVFVRAASPRPTSPPPRSKPVTCMPCMRSTVVATAVSPGSRQPAQPVRAPAPTARSPRTLTGYKASAARAERRDSTAVPVPPPTPVPASPPAPPPASPVSATEEQQATVARRLSLTTRGEVQQTLHMVTSAVRAADVAVEVASFNLRKRQLREELALGAGDKAAEGDSDDDNDTEYDSADSDCASSYGGASECSFSQTQQRNLQSLSTARHVHKEQSWSGNKTLWRQGVLERIDEMRRAVAN